MAVKTCEEVLRGMGYAADGTAGKKVTSDSANGGNTDGGDFLDSVIKAAGKVNATAQELYMYDCSDHLVEWMYGVCPSLKTAGKKIDAVAKKMNSITTGVKIAELIQGNKFSQEFCNVVTTVFGSVNAWLEVITKAAFALFDKIDTARERMQTALKSITDAVLTCILDVYDMIEKYLGGLLKVSLNWDWEAFEKLLIDCPCLCRFVAYVTGCDEDADGKSISDSPDLVLRCVREKYWYLDGINLAEGLSELMDTYIKQYVILMFDAIKLAIDSIFTLFIAPFRYLIKQYADLLRQKMDVTFMVEPLKVSHLDCLLTYERDTVAGKTVYRMSVLDMMSSMKMWVNCLEHICPALSERIKNKVKKFNEDFRLNGEYWNRAFEADIYQCCMRADAAYESGFSLEQLGNMWDDLLDRLRALNDRAKNKVFRAKVTYGLYPSSTGGYQHYTDRMRISGPYAGTDGGQSTAVADAVLFVSTSDLENNLSPGPMPLSDSEDSILRKVGLSVAEGTGEDSYFAEKWAQYVRFLGMYAFSEETLTELSEAMEKGMHISNPSRSGSGNQFPGITVRRPVETGEEDLGVNYWVDSDYDQERVDAIENIEWTGRRSTESLPAYYARMYSTAV